MLTYGVFDVGPSPGSVHCEVIQSVARVVERKNTEGWVRRVIFFFSLLYCLAGVDI